MPSYLRTARTAKNASTGKTGRQGTHGRQGKTGRKGKNAHSVPKVLTIIRRILTASAGLAAHFCAAAGQVYVFARFLHADGPTELLASTGGITACLPYLSRKCADYGRKRASHIFNAAAVTAGSIFCALIVFQVFAAKRSLAEAWLVHARKGQAFGFFSFFAAEIFAVLVLLVSVLKTKKRYVSYICASCAALLCCFGIIYGNTLYLVLSAVLGACSAAAAGTRSMPSSRARSEAAGDSASGIRAAAAVFPLLLTLVSAVLLTAAGEKSQIRPADIIPIDFSRIAAAAAPHFPLLVDIPGYGFTAGSSQIESRVFLSPRTLFYVSGPSEKVLYLQTEVFSRYNSGQWQTVKMNTNSITAPPLASHTGGLLKTTLTLADDFYPVIPVTKKTIQTIVRSSGLDGGFRRGDSADIFEDDSAPDAYPPPDSTDTDPGIYSPELSKLAKSLKAQAGNTPEEYISAVLRLFREQYVYTLDAGKKSAGEDPVLYFLFTSKKGFCVHFASSFVLLAREAGIPCRLAEGFRSETDDTGHGTVTGTNAHAWAEVYLDGQWHTVETTSHLRTGDSFSVSGFPSMQTQQNKEQDTDGEDEESDDSTGNSRYFSKKIQTALTAAAGAAALCIALSILIVAFYRKKYSADLFNKKRKILRRLVRTYGRKKIISPEVSGWNAWIGKVEVLSHDDSEKARLIIAEYYSGSAVTSTSSLERLSANDSASDRKD